LNFYIKFSFFKKVKNFFKLNSLFLSYKFFFLNQKHKTNRNNFTTYINTSSKALKNVPNILNFNNRNFITTNFVTFYFFNNTRTYFSFLQTFLFNFKINLKSFLSSSLWIFKTFFGEGFLYVRGLFIIFFIDACLTDDEPLWEPIEWSLVQSWLLFIFAFAWIAENLITSRYGSYTGRDKRVWYAWYRTFWLIDSYYAITYGVAALFIIVPFYYELTYNVSFIFSWWHWYSRVFFFKFISIYSLVILIAYLLQLNIRWFNWKKLFFFIVIINCFLAYMLYTHFIMAFFGYFTDPLWYQKTRFIDYIQLSHEPLKWGWGPAKRDHFTYHKVSTVFWFKNDGPFAGSFLMIHIFFFFSLFLLYIYWVVLLRRVYTTKEISYTFATYCFSFLKKFYYFFFLLYAFIFLSFISNYWRFPIEFLWLSNSNSWALNFLFIIKDYWSFLLNIF